MLTWCPFDSCKHVIHVYVVTDADHTWYYRTFNAYYSTSRNSRSVFDEGMRYNEPILPRPDL